MEQTNRQRADQLVIDYVKKRRVNKEGIPIAHAIKQVRAHFSSLKMSRAAAGLDCNWQEVIDELIAADVVIVTNGFAWVRPKVLQEP